MTAGKKNRKRKLSFTEEIIKTLKHHDNTKNILLSRCHQYESAAAAALNPRPDMKQPLKPPTKVFLLLETHSNKNQYLNIIQIKLEERRMARLAQSAFNNVESANIRLKKKNQQLLQLGVR